MTLTNIGLVEFAKSKIGTPYVYGMKGTVMTLPNYEYLLRTYPKYMPLSDENKIGLVCVDCSGLISWYTHTSRNSDNYHASAEEVHDISTIDTAPVGVAVWRQGHIGVYIGDGEIIEARGSAFGTVRTKVAERDFTHWFKLVDLEYDEDEDMTKETFAELMTEYRADLQDNDCGTWSEEARQWAIDNSMIFGSGETESGEPNYMWADMLTREQLVVMFYRLVQKYGLE